MSKEVSIHFSSLAHDPSRRQPLPVFLKKVLWLTVVQKRFKLTQIARAVGLLPQSGAGARGSSDTSEEQPRRPVFLFLHGGQGDQAKMDEFGLS